MSNVIKTKKTRQRTRNTSSMTAKSKELNMSKLESDEPDSVEGFESTQEEFAARFLLSALQDLHLVDNTITVEDLDYFADEVRKDMGLMIGSEKFLREIFDIDNEINFGYRKNHYEVADQLHEKIIVAQQNLAKEDRDFPF